MKVGISYTPTDGKLRKWAEQAEEQGFDSLWVGDHLLYAMDGLVAASAVVAATANVTVGTAVYLLGLRDPLVTARSVATLLEEAGERFVFGVGLGGDVPSELRAVGLARAELKGRLEHCLETVRDLIVFGETRRDERLLGLVFRHRSESQLNVWRGGRSRAAVAHAIGSCDGIMPYLVTPKQLAEMKEWATAAAGERVIEWGCVVQVACAVDRNVALSSLRSARPYGLSDRQLERYCVTGTPDDCARELARFKAAGVDHLVLRPVGPGLGASDDGRMIRSYLRNALA